MIFNQDGRILLIHRNKPDLQWWELPGGKVDSGETPETTAVREIKEEIGVEVKITESLGHTFFEYYDINWQYYWFKAEIIGDKKPVICEPENFDGLQYFAINDLKNKPDLSPNVKNLLAKLT